MENNNAQQTAEQDLKRLEARIDELLQMVDRLKEENRTLRSRQEAFTSERAQLIEKNDMARTRVEAMISRLKSLEQSA